MSLELTRIFQVGKKKDLLGSQQQGVHLKTIERGAHINPICYSQHSVTGMANQITATKISSDRRVMPIGLCACKRHAQRYTNIQKHL